MSLERAVAQLGPSKQVRLLALTCLLGPTCLACSLRAALLFLYRSTQEWDHSTKRVGRACYQVPTARCPPPDACRHRDEHPPAEHYWAPAEGKRPHRFMLPPAAFKALLEPSQTTIATGSQPVLGGEERRLASAGRRPRRRICYNEEQGRVAAGANGDDGSGSGSDSDDDLPLAQVLERKRQAGRSNAEGAASGLGPVARAVTEEAATKLSAVVGLAAVQQPSCGAQDATDAAEGGALLATCGEGAGASPDSLLGAGSQHIVARNLQHLDPGLLVHSSSEGVAAANVVGAEASLGPAGAKAAVTIPDRCACHMACGVVDAQECGWACLVLLAMCFHFMILMQLSCPPLSAARTSGRAENIVADHLEGQASILQQCPQLLGGVLACSLSCLVAAL